MRGPPARLVGPARSRGTDVPEYRVRQHGRDAARHAFNEATSIVSGWTVRGIYRGRIDDLMHRFHGSKWSASWNDPTLLASQYLPAVALTRLLVSPDWKSLALHPEGDVGG